MAGSWVANSVCCITLVLVVGTYAAIDNRPIIGIVMEEITPGKGK